MQISVNGQLRSVPENCTAAQLVAELGLEGRRIALEVNLDIVPRSAYPRHQLQAGDRVEIVQAIGGG